MSDLDKTLQLVPISLIESIIMNSDTFFKFIRTPNDSLFLDLNSNDIVHAINEYMEYVTKSSENLTKDNFEKVNYINKYYHVDKSYDFELYLEKTTPLVNIKLIESILYDQDTFDKFMDFNNNKEYFEYDISIYLMALNSMMDYYDKTAVELPTIASQRFTKIMETYSLDLKIFHQLSGYKNKEDISQDLKDKILKNIDLQQDSFTIARAIYIELCKCVTYDVNFIALDQNLENPAANDIYEKKINQINTTSNIVVCKTWAEIYQTLLQRVGIEATVAGGFHKYVTFNCDGTLMKADATNSYSSAGTNFYMNDITRVQAGLDTAGFVCLEPNKNIALPLQEADETINFHTTSLEKTLNELEQSYCTVVADTNDETKIKNKLDSLISLANHTSLKGFELSKYIKMLTKIYFKSASTYEVKCHYACQSNSDNEFDSIILFTISNDITNKYIMYQKGKEILSLTQNDLLALLNNGKIKLLGKVMTLPGIKEENNEYTSTSRQK